MGSNSTVLVSIDPGLATGISVGVYGLDKPYTLEGSTITQEGVYGFSEWFSRGRIDPWAPNIQIVVEGFNLLARNEFVADLSGVEVIGYIKGLGWPVTWQTRSDKSLVPDYILQRHGMWSTGKEVNHKDGRDANDATIHALA